MHPSSFRCVCSVFRSRRNLPDQDTVRDFSLEKTDRKGKRITVKVKGSATGCQEEEKQLDAKKKKSVSFLLVILSSVKESKKKENRVKLIKQFHVNRQLIRLLGMCCNKSQEKIGERKVCLVICFRCCICSVLGPNGQTTHWYVRRWDD